MKDAPDNVVELRARALRLLARREHSQQELARKLVPHAQSSEAVGEILESLTQRKQLSEERYAEARARQLARKYGAAKIRQDLKAKGVSDELIEKVSSEGELERARAILERKFPVKTKDRKERARRMRFLQSRGFSSDVIFSLLSARGDA